MKQPMRERPGSPFLPVTDEAREAARRIVREARHAVLACLEPATGDPLASRVAVSSDITGDPIILVSDLSAHTAALLADPRASILFGSPGAGDPLAHPRVTVRGSAERISEDHRNFERVRRRFLARMPGAESYAGFADFHFMRIGVTQGLFNGGFARAYQLMRTDLSDDVSEDVTAAEERVCRHLNEDHREAIDAIVSRHLGETTTGWHVATVDARGFDARQDDRIVRIAFRGLVERGDGFRQAFVDLASPGRRTDQGL